MTAPASESRRRSVLVVDDEELFLRTVRDGFAAFADRVEVHTAPNGDAALKVLEEREIDLVVTDLKMPVMDGFELIAYMSRSWPDIPVVVMSAFGTREIEGKLERQGVALFLDKPLDIQVLRDKVFEVLAASATGHLQGIALATFLQMVEADRKTCVLRVRQGDEAGTLWFKKGELLDAALGTLGGEAAAMRIARWERPEIDIVPGKVVRTKVVQMPLAELLLEAFRQLDEEERNRKKGGATGAPPQEGPARHEGVLAESVRREAVVMAAVDKLKELAGIEGFAGAALYTPAGETLAVLQGETQHLKEVGILANNVLLNAQKASLEMGTGRGQQVHVEAEKANIMARCLNEGTDPIKSQPGKAHIHLVMVLKSDAAIGLAKMRMNATIEKLAEDFR